jgi:hypothetical protein
MKKLTFGDALLGLCGLICGIAGAFYLMSIGHASGAHTHFGFGCAINACIWTSISCWAICFAFVVQKREWTIKSCNYAWALPALIGFALMWVYLGQPRGFFGLALSLQSLLAQMLVRRLAFPDAKENYVPQPPPSLSLSSK